MTTASSVCWSVRSCSLAVDALSRNCLSSASFPSGVAIPVPGDLMGNSSSSGIGIGGPIRPRIEDPVFVRAGPSTRHFPAPRNLLIIGTRYYTLVCPRFKRIGGQGREGLKICICWLVLGLRALRRLESVIGAPDILLRSYFIVRYIKYAKSRYFSCPLSSWTIALGGDASRIIYFLCLSTLDKERPMKRV